MSTLAGELTLHGVVNLKGGPVESDISKKEREAFVFIFLSVDCPISNRYAPTLRKLKKEFPKIQWVLVYPNPGESAESIQDSLREYELPFEAWRDVKHSLVKAAEVSITPEAAVFLPRAGWVYRGRIDDQYVDFDKHRVRAQTNDLREILMEIQNGVLPQLRVTKAVGCYISKLEN